MSWSRFYRRRGLITGLGLGVVVQNLSRGVSAQLSAPRFRTFERLDDALADPPDPGAHVEILCHSKPGDGGGFRGVVENGHNARNPGGGIIRPTEPANVRFWGAKGDGDNDDHAACQAAAEFCDKISSAAAAGSKGIAGQNLLFPHGEYNFYGRALVLPPKVDPVAMENGDVIIRRGGFFLPKANNNVIRGFVFVDPPVVKGLVQNVSNEAPIAITSTDHSFRDGDWVRFRCISGMPELNGRGFVVGQVATDGFVLEDSDGRSWGRFSGGGEVLSGAAIEFFTNNVSRAQIKIEDCACFGSPDAGQCFVSSRSFEKSRSTELTISGCETQDIDRIIHSTCDSLTVKGGFFWQSSSKEAPFYSKGKVKVFGGMLIPRDLSTGARWWDYDVWPKGFATSAAFYGVRFSGEGGGIAVLKVLDVSNDVSKRLVFDTILFDACQLISQKGGPDGEGGVVVLGATQADNHQLAVPNGIEFRACDVTLSRHQYLVRGEITTVPALRDGYNFRVSIDDMSRRLFDRLGQHPLPDYLLPYLDGSTRATMMGRIQVLRGEGVKAPDILMGAVIEIGGWNIDFDITVGFIHNARPGDRLTLIAQDNTSLYWRVAHGKGNGMNFYLANGMDFAPETENATLSLTVDTKGNAREISRT